MDPVGLYKPNTASAFSLVELLVVMGVIAILIGLAGPSLTSTNSASQLTNSAYSLQGILDQARTYAMANNTYTWVGIYEEDGSQPSRTPASSGKGRLIICVVASRDGTQVYDKATAQNQTAQTLPGSKLLVIGKLQRLDGVHVFNASARSVGKRPANFIAAQDVVGLVTTPQLFSFQYPLSGQAAYVFGSGPSPGASGVVQFNPMGEAMSNSGSVDAPPNNLEITIRGAQSSSDDVPNVIALDVGGITGQTVIFRP